MTGAEPGAVSNLKGASKGARVTVVDASGRRHPATTTSGIEGTHHGGGRKVHDFPVIWVLIDGYSGAMPWPVESVLQQGDSQ